MTGENKHNKAKKSVLIETLGPLGCFTGLGALVARYVIRSSLSCNVRTPVRHIRVIRSVLDK